MSLPWIRNLLYLIARLLGDVSAVKRGTVGKTPRLLPMSGPQTCRNLFLA